MACFQKEIMFGELREQSLLYSTHVSIKWSHLLFHFYFFSTQFLFILFCSVCCVEGSLKANLSGSGELASDAVMGSPQGSLHCLARPYSQHREAWLHQRDLSYQGALMRTQVVQCYFCSGLLYFITRQSTASWEQACARLTKSYGSTAGLHKG